MRERAVIRTYFFKDTDMKAECPYCKKTVYRKKLLQYKDIGHYFFNSHGYYDFGKKLFKCVEQDIDRRRKYENE